MAQHAHHERNQRPAVRPEPVEGPPPKTDDATRKLISIHPEAPDKPLPGMPCNGCGVCCAIETCPSGRLLFQQGAGPCPALVWHGPAQRYHCGLLTQPEHYCRWLPGFARPLAKRLFRRWIAAGIGCDSSAVIE